MKITKPLLGAEPAEISKPHALSSISPSRIAANLHIHPSVQLDNHMPYTPLSNISYHNQSANTLKLNLIQRLA